jgi:zinc/manganese transport system ATP-binding protein
MANSTDAGPAPVLELDRVRAGHPGLLALDGVSLRVHSGRTLAVVGPNGAGKTTLLDVIAGVHPVLGGRVVRHSRMRPAYVLQRPSVSDALPMTVRSTVEMGRWGRRGPWRRLGADDRAIVEECLALLGLTELADRGLGELSGGQRQRALVAQSLAQQSDLLLLDEPSSGLDLQAQAMIEDAVERTRAEGTAVVRITHDPAVARRADDCVVVAGGRLAAQGDPEEALRTGALLMAGLTTG